MNSGVFYVIPLLVVLGLFFLMYSRTRDRRPGYTLSQPWTHDPILWAAVDEVLPGGGHHGHGSDEVSLGGGASGKW